MHGADRWKTAFTEYPKWLLRVRSTFNAPLAGNTSPSHPGTLSSVKKPISHQNHDGIAVRFLCNSGGTWTAARAALQGNDLWGAPYKQDSDTGGYWSQPHLCRGPPDGLIHPHFLLGKLPRPLRCLRERNLEKWCKIKIPGSNP